MLLFPSLTQSTPTFEQGGPSSTFEFGGTSHAAPPTQPSPHHTDPDPVLASLQRLHLSMDGFDQWFDQIEAQQSRFDHFMVDYMTTIIGKGI